MKSNPDNETQGREDSRLTAFLLGELDPAAQAVIQSQLESDPELNERFQSLKQSSDWLLNAAKSGVFSNNQFDEQWKLSEPSRTELLRRLRQSHSDVPSSTTSKWQTLFNAGLSSWLTRFGAPIAACFLACLAALIFILPQLQMARSSAAFSPDMAGISAEDSAESMDFYESDGIVTDFGLAEEQASASVNRYSYFARNNDSLSQEPDLKLTDGPQSDLFGDENGRQVVSRFRTAGRQVRVAEAMTTEPTPVRPGGPQHLEASDSLATQTYGNNVANQESRASDGLSLQINDPAEHVQEQEIAEFNNGIHSPIQDSSPWFAPIPAASAPAPAPAPTERFDFAGGLGGSGNSIAPSAKDGNLNGAMEGQSLVTATAETAKLNENFYSMRGGALGEAEAPVPTLQATDKKESESFQTSTKTVKLISIPAPKREEIVLELLNESTSIFKGVEVEGLEVQSSGMQSRGETLERKSTRSLAALNSIPNLDSSELQLFNDETDSDFESDSDSDSDSDFTTPYSGAAANQPSDKTSLSNWGMERRVLTEDPSKVDVFFDSGLNPLGDIEVQSGAARAFSNEKSSEVIAGARFGTEERFLKRGKSESQENQLNALNFDSFNRGYEMTELKQKIDHSVGKPLVKQVELGESIALGMKKINTPESPAESPIAPSRSSATKEIVTRDFQEEIPVAENEFSTFALQVRDVSFESALAALQNGALPDPATMRSEEFLNAFDYGMPEPDQTSKLGFDYELSGFPFEHQRLALRVSLKTAASGREASKPMNLVAALDNSGSMERPDRAAITQGAFQKLTELLGPQDRLSVIAFSRQPRLWMESVAGGNPDEVLARLGLLNPEGGTNLEAALDLAYEVAQRNFIPNGENRVVLLTDGAANLGQVDPESLAEKVMDNRRQGIALDTFGIGWEGLNDPLLERLSRNGDGRYAFMNDPLTAPTEFANELAGALQVAAKQVKIQMEWNPDRVKSYRLIGYAKNRLTAEQFRDNSVDAGELAAREAGSAIYTLELVPNGTGPIATARARYQDPDSGTFKEKTWNIPYQSAPSLDEASPAQQLAVVSSLFGEWLSQAPRSEQYPLNEMMNSLRSAKGAFGFNPRIHQLEFMIQQAQSLTGVQP